MVSNTGPVVPAYEIDNLFEPFRRLRTERTGSDKGVGPRPVHRALRGAGARRPYHRASPARAGGLVMRVTLPV